MCPKINYRRLKTWIPKMPVKKVNKIQVPDSVYDRTKEKERIRKEIEKVRDEDV